MSDTNKNEKRVVVLPDYIEGAEVHVIHKWREWEALSNKIDNYPGRFQDVVHPKSGAVKTFDCKTPIGMMKKILAKHSATEDDFERVMIVTKELQQLKTRKGKANTAWSKYVFGKKKGDSNILSIRQTELLDLFGKFYTVDEVKKIVQHEWGFAVKPDSIKKFYVDNSDKIDRKRADYVLKGKETRLATDAGRMEVLSKLAWEMETRFKRTKSLEVSKELRAIIEQIRKEIKGDEIRLTIDGKIDIKASIQANQSIHEVLQKLPINMLIVGITAAKQKVNPAEIIASLANSYYSQFNGFSTISDPSSIELPGQFIKQYDWGEIERKNTALVEDVTPIETYEEAIPIEAKPIIFSKKQDLIKLLNKFKQDAEK